MAKIGIVSGKMLYLQKSLKKHGLMKKRYVSLDVLRGLTVAMMIIVNNPGSWGCIFPPLRHAAWDGCTPTDLVFPFFLFCAGASMAFSFSRYKSLNADALKKILKRGLLIFIVGLGLNAFPFYPTYPDPELTAMQNWGHWLSGLRIFGVLQRIALCYIVSSVLALWLKSPGKVIGAVVALSAAHVGLLLAFAGPEGAFTLEGCFARRLDAALIGENHLYDGYTFADGTTAPFDPEGLLGVLTGTCTALLGYICALVIKDGGRKPALPTEAVLLLYSAAFIALSQILKIWIPVNKPLWSVSYVFLTAGWAAMGLGILSFIIDRKGWERPFVPFKAMGMNPLAIYVLSCISAKSIYAIFGWDTSAVFGTNEWMSLLYALLFMLAHMAVAMILYKKKIIIKL